ncbi:hypothetical protein [Porphyromonas sp. COT-239 OH1446]|uniref:hypothetical protein n=1 Tax=Porphyromonas sp. COT-239 OH1446 TaxID=1515613 RepID=UPI000AA87119|nr:hypothetical protein [Porphyromonas sp. COT-239 OH1446]
MGKILSTIGVILLFSLVAAILKGLIFISSIVLKIILLLVLVFLAIGILIKIWRS